MAATGNTTLDLVKTINNITDENGIKVNVGFNTVDMIVIGAVILVAATLSGILVHLITSKLSK